jgi:hypothetical protein
MENFIKLDYELLKRADINLEEKLIIAYILGWQKSNKYCFETKKEISDKLGIKLTTFKDRLKSLNDKKIIFISNDRKYLIPFNNRKVIILVDEENPYPIENIVSKEVKVEEVIDTPIQPKEHLKTEIIEDDVNTTLQLNNGKIVSIKKEYEEVYNNIFNDKPVKFKELKNSTGQGDFEYTLKCFYESYNQMKELENL